MVLRNLPSQWSTCFCFCSEMSYEDILEKQKNTPLKFKEFLDEYTRCNQGCGSCIDNFYSYLTETNLLIT
jgi:bacterioferritin-associated ferredoxin